MSKLSPATQGILVAIRASSERLWGNCVTAARFSSVDLALIDKEIDAIRFHRADLEKELDEDLTEGGTR